MRRNFTNFSTIVECFGLITLIAFSTSATCNTTDNTNTKYADETFKVHSLNVNLQPHTYNSPGSDKVNFLLNEESIRILLNTTQKFSTVNELTEGLETWEAPEDFKKKYPYYLSGHDDEGRPIWIAEFGRWNLRQVVEEGGESLETFDKHIRQAAYRAIKSLEKKASEDDPYPELIFLADFDELSMTQLAHTPTLKYFLRLVREMEPILFKHTSVGYIVNANYVTERLIELVRPVLGAVFERIEVYGTNSAKWIPRLLRRLPKSEIPYWYGGSKDFKPLAVYG